jgi:hypothetical protein
VTPLLWAIAAYLLLQFGIGVVVSRRIATEDDYLIAGRRLGPWVATASIFATWFGAETIVGSAALVLLLQADTRRTLLRPSALIMGVMALALQLLWLYGVQSGGAQAARFAGEIGAKLVPPSIGAWVLKLFAYPLEIGLRLLPASGLALYAWWRLPAVRTALARGSTAWTAALIGLLCFLPYWLAPHSNFRYLLPIVPLAAIVFAELIAQGSERLRTVAYRLMWAAIALKLMFVAIAFPLYQAQYRGANYATAAQAIIGITHGQPLYAANVSATGLSVTAHINIARLPLPALTFPPAQWSDGFVITYEPDPQVGEIATQYRLGGNILYLLCRGAACATTRQP